MPRMKPRTLPIGSISSGTLRPEDLIPSFLWEAERLRLTREERATVREIRKRFDALPSGNRWNGHDEPAIDWTDDQHDIAADDLERLQDLLSNHVPDYCTFGAHEGDGADFGVWPTLDFHDRASMEAEGIHVSGDTPTNSEHGARGASHWLYVNDHGNCTLYRRAGRTWKEVWSIV